MQPSSLLVRLWFLAWVVGASSTGLLAASGAEEIEPLLQRLARVSSLYRDSALQFECRESIRYTFTGKGTHAKKFAYLFVYDDEEGFIDYRLTRRQIEMEDTLEEARPEEFGIGMFLKNAYLFTQLFSERRQPFYRYSVEGEERVLGRPATRLFLAPELPMQPKVNEWLGRFWIDSETSQILKVEAYEAESATDWVSLQSDLVHARYAAEVFYREYVLEKVTVEFDVERNGMRFPSRVDIVLQRYELLGGRPERNSKPRKLARTKQNFTDYRFFEIKTAEEISKHIEGGGD